MSAEGRVAILLSRSGGPAQVRYHQPLDAGRLLTGKALAGIPALVAQLYPVCGHAHAHASALAIGAVTARPADPVTQAARAALVAAETLRENALRILLDWPRLIGEAPDAAPARRFMALPPALRKALFSSASPFQDAVAGKPERDAAAATMAEGRDLIENAILGEAGEDWLQRRGTDALRDWAQSGRTVAARLFATLVGEPEPAAPAFPALRLPRDGDPTGWAAALTREGGMALPDDACGVTAEATLYSRRAGEPIVRSLPEGGLLARLAARLAELARLPGEIAALVAGTMAPPIAVLADEGRGLACVEAARGLLVHAVLAEEGRAAEYRILAPTQRNFAGDGLAAALLDRLPGRSEAERLRLAHLAVNAVDPCVSYRIGMV